jgi:poly-beta-1,6-N-acetyl-D-glucosamine synthase
VDMTYNKKQYVIITPVKDEEKYIERTLTSVMSQTIPPLRWVIVDDGSSDRTVEIIKKITRDVEWINLVENVPRTTRNTGVAEVVAFNSSLEMVWSLDFEFVVKLDGDVLLCNDYFEKILEKFDKDECLGIASGAYLEDHGKGWRPVKLPLYHAAGASKIIRKKCFKSIGGFCESIGWDTVDEIKAQYLGWRTRHFPEIKFFHLKNEGSGMGNIKTSVMHGEIFYLTGGRLLFFILKFVKRAVFGRPLLISGIMMLHGYLKSMLTRKNLLVSKEEAEKYNQLLAGRFYQGMGKLCSYKARS